MNIRDTNISPAQAVYRVRLGGGKPPGCSVARWAAIVRHVTREYGAYL